MFAKRNTEQNLKMNKSSVNGIPNINMLLSCQEKNMILNWVPWSRVGGKHRITRQGWVSPKKKEKTPTKEELYKCKL